MITSLTAGLANSQNGMRHSKAATEEISPDTMNSSSHSAKEAHNNNKDGNFNDELMKLAYEKRNSYNSRQSSAETQASSKLHNGCNSDIENTAL